MDIHIITRKQQHIYKAVGTAANMGNLPQTGLEIGRVDTKSDLDISMR